MQDRFKFRAWNKEFEKFLVHNKEDKTFSLHIFENICESDRFEVLQCTGLKDKNDKFIYEGDILKLKILENFNVFGTNEKYVEIIAPIVFEYGGFFIEQSENSIFLGQFPMSEIEVIGNIYENPELIGGE